MHPTEPTSASHRRPVLRAMLLFVATAVLACVVQAQDVARTISARCCVVVDEPFAWRKDTGRTGPATSIADFDGIAIEVFNATVAELRKDEKNPTSLECSTVETFDTSGASGASGLASNALIEHLAACNSSAASCRCDIGIGAWFETPSRVAVKFLPAYIYDAVRVGVPWQLAQSGASSNLFFLLAFDADVWGAIALLIALFTALKVLDSRFAEDETAALQHGPGASSDEEAGRNIFARAVRAARNSQRAEKVRFAVQSTLNHLLGFCFLELDEARKTTRQWLINYIIALCGLFLVLVYEATMTARLVQENNDTQFRFPRDFTSCKINPKDVCFVKGDFMEKYWTDVITKHHCHRRFQETADGAQQKPEPTPRAFENFESMFESVQRGGKGDCLYMLGGGGQVGMATELNRCGKIAPAGEPFLTRGVSMVVSRSWPHTSDVAVKTLEVVRQRSNRTSVSEYFADKGSCPREEGVQLPFRVMRVYFAVAFGACFVMLIHMVVVRMIHARQNELNSADSFSTQSLS